MDDYWQSHYDSTAECGVDTLRVRKSNRTEWSEIELRIHGELKSEITIRSRQHAEHLHFMLGQMLGK